MGPDDIARPSVGPLAAHAVADYPTFATHDRDIAVEHVSRVLSSHLLEVRQPSSPFEAVISVGGYGSVDLFLMRYGPAVKVSRQPDDDYITVSVPITGRMTGHHWGEDFTIGPGGSMLVLSTDSFHMDWAPGTSIVGLRANQDALASRLGLLAPELGSAEPLTFTPSVHSVIATQILVGAMQLLTFAPRTDGKPTERVCRRISEQTLDTILVALQHNYSMALADSPRWISTRVVREAVDRIAVEREAHLTVGELAALAGVSLRSLEAGFRRELGCTPLQYLHRSRLLKARDELVAQGAHEGSRLTVAAIATRWGFYHLGRFAATFRKEFGQTPSQLLRAH